MEEDVHLHQQMEEMLLVGGEHEIYPKTFRLSFEGFPVTKQPTAEETIYFLFAPHDPCRWTVMWRVFRCY